MIPGVVLAVVALAVFLLLFGGGRTRTARNWPTTSGTIVALRKGGVVDADTRQTGWLPAGSNRRPVTRVSVSYQAADGSQRTLRKQISHRAGQRVHVGDRVTVAVHPSRPGAAVVRWKTPPV